MSAGKKDSGAGGGGAGVKGMLGVGTNTKEAYQLTVVFVEGAPYNGIPDQQKMNQQILTDLQTAVEE